MSCLSFVFPTLTLKITDNRTSKYEETNMSTFVKTDLVERIKKEMRLLFLTTMKRKGKYEENR